MAPRIEQFEVWPVAKTAARFCGRRAGVFLGLLAIAAAPACALAVLTGLFAEIPIAVLVLTLLLAAASAFGIAWAEAGAIHFVVSTLRVAPPTLAETLQPALRKCPHVLVVHILVNVAAGLGSLLLLVPGIVLMLMFWVAVPATVVEGGIVSAMRRSHELTRGHKWRVLGLLALLLAAFVAAGVAFATGAAMLATLLAQWWAFALVQLFQVATYMVWGVVTAVSYYHLRTIAEQRAAPTTGRGTGP